MLRYSAAGRAPSTTVLVLAVLAVSLVSMLWLGVQYVRFAWGQETPVLNWNFGLGAAMSVLLLLFLLVVTGAYLLITNRRSRRA